MDSSINLDFLRDRGSFSLVLRIYRDLSRDHKYLVFFLILLMALSGFAEALSLASVIPFLSLLTNPDKYFAGSNFDFFVQIVGKSHPDQLIYISALCFVFAILLAASIRVLTLYITSLSTAWIGSDFSLRAYSTYLRQDYLTHININSSTIINTIAVQVDLLILTISCALQFLTCIVVCCSIFFMLLAIDWKLAVVSGTFLSIFYILVGFLNKKRLDTNSQMISLFNSRVIKSLNEGLGLIKDLHLYNLYDHYVSMYSSSDVPLRRLQAQNRFIRGFPRYIFESVGIIFIICAALLIDGDNRDSLIPTLGALALGSQRLLLSLQQAFSSWGGIRSHSAAVISVLSMINLPLSASYHSFGTESKAEFDSLKIINVSFKYPNSAQFALRNVNISITKGEKVGVIGETGAGKSTFVNILLGLLPYSSGEISINDNLVPYGNLIADWNQMTSYVPQDIYLTDGSFYENIAVGKQSSDISNDLVISSAKKASIHDFILSLPQGYDSLVGERGVRLSGGQRQRLGLARALYRNASIIVLDEATSSLDTNTEYSVMKAIENLNNDITIIIIAHRLSTLKNCDKVVEVKNGQVISVAPSSLDSPLL